MGNCDFSRECRIEVPDWRGDALRGEWESDGVFQPPPMSPTAGTHTFRIAATFSGGDTREEYLALESVDPDVARDRYSRPLRPDQIPVCMTVAYRPASITSVDAVAR